jgi:hypothetical protein
MHVLRTLVREEFAQVPLDGRLQCVVRVCGKNPINSRNQQPSCWDAPLDVRMVGFEHAYRCWQRSAAAASLAVLITFMGPVLRAEEPQREPCTEEAMIVFDASGSMAGNENFDIWRSPVILSIGTYCSISALFRRVAGPDCDNVLIAALPHSPFVRRMKTDAPSNARLG